MRRAQRPAALAVVAALAVAAGCKCGEPRPGAEVKAPTTTQGGIRVPMPDGWSAHLANDESLMIGPPTRPLLRIDLQPGGGANLPSTDKLVTEYSKHSENKLITVDSQTATTDASIVILTIRGGDAPAAPAVVTLLGAKRVDGDLFLCSSEPGATEVEVRGAAETCRGLSAPR